MAPNRKLGLCGISLTTIRPNQHTSEAANQVMDLVEPWIISSSYLENAPFEWVCLSHRFGFKNEEAPHYLGIDEEQKDLDLAIELDSSELQFANREELTNQFLIATLKALIHAGMKYDLPVSKLEHELEKCEWIRLTGSSQATEKKYSETFKQLRMEGALLANFEKVRKCDMNLIFLGARGLKDGKIPDDILPPLTTSELLIPEIVATGFLKSAPFDAIYLVMQFGVCWGKVEIDTINPDKEMELSVDFPLSEICAMSSEEYFRTAFSATLMALIVLGEKYQLPTDRWQELLENLGCQENVQTAYLAKRHPYKFGLFSVNLTWVEFDYQPIRIIKEVRDEIEEAMIESEYLSNAPFEWVTLSLKFGLEDEEVPHYEEIDKKYGDLPLAIELDCYELEDISREKFKQRLESATLKSLIHAGKRYNLPTSSLQDRLGELA